MNLGQIRALACSWLDDVNQTYFTPAQMNVFINNAQRECQKQLLQNGENYYTVRASAPTVQNQDVYSLPLDFLKINKLEILVTGTTPNQVRQLLTPVTLVTLDQVSMTTGLPVAYAMKKNCFVLRPIPDNTYTLYLDYSYRVIDMTVDSSIPDVPQQYHEYLAVLAAIDGFLKDQRDPSPFFTKRDFYLSLMKQDAENRDVSAPRSIIMSDDLFGDGFIY